MGILEDKDHNRLLALIVAEHFVTNLTDSPPSACQTINYGEVFPDTAGVLTTLERGYAYGNDD
jgi:hypothetical protein